MLKLYVGCGLTQAPPEFVAGIDFFKRSIRERGQFEVFDFMGLTHGSPADVYRRDIEECVATCDLFLAICDYPSTGLGFELAAGLLVHQKPTLAVAHADSTVSRLVLGIPHRRFRFDRYRKLDDVHAMLGEFELSLIL